MNTRHQQAGTLYTNVICQKADGNCFLGEERSADVGIYATGDHSNLTSVLRNIKNYVRPFRRKGVEC
jgi:hypothetical protein